MSLVDKIKKLCEERNMSVPTLEKEFGFGYGSIYRWDTNTPSIDRVQKVADYFGVSIDSLVREGMTANGNQAGLDQACS